jgi:hypothetical protein
MNDRQLRRLLHEWQVEDPPPALDLRVLDICKSHGAQPAAGRISAIAAGVRGKSLWAAAVLGAVFLTVVTEAIPQTVKIVSPPGPVPYTVDSEYIRHAEDGSHALAMLSTSYTDQNGAEVILERTILDHAIETAAGRTLDVVLPLWSRLISPLMVSSEDLERYRQAKRPRSAELILGCGGQDLLSA